MVRHKHFTGSHTGGYTLIDALTLPFQYFGLTRWFYFQDMRFIRPRWLTFWISNSWHLQAIGKANIHKLSINSLKMLLSILILYILHIYPHNACEI